MRKPFYKKSHKCWYFRNDAGDDIRLDPNEDKAHRLWQLALANQFLDDQSCFAILAEAWMQEHKA